MENSWEDFFFTAETISTIRQSLSDDGGNVIIPYMIQISPLDVGHVARKKKGAADHVKNQCGGYVDEAS